MGRKTIIEYVKLDRRNEKMMIEDVIKKSILPLAFMLFWFWMVSTIMKVSGQTCSGGYFFPDFHWEYIKCG